MKRDRRLPFVPVGSRCPAWSPGPVQEDSDYCNHPTPTQGNECKVYPPRPILRQSPNPRQRRAGGPVVLVTTERTRKLCPDWPSTRQREESSWSVPVFDKPGCIEMRSRGLTESWRKCILFRPSKLDLRTQQYSWGKYRNLYLSSLMEHLYTRASLQLRKR